MRAWHKWPLAVWALDRLLPVYLYLLLTRRRILVFGTGGIAEGFLGFCPLNPNAFLDNDIGKQGGTFRGKPVMAPSSLIESEGKPFHVFVASSYHEEIAEQLKALSVPRSRISFAFPDPRLGLVGKAGLQALVDALLIPLIMLFSAPASLFRSLWNCRVLAEGRWSGFAAFNPFRALNSCFYWPSAYLLRKYGRSGTAPNFALGDYPVSRFFYYCLPSLYLYRDLPIIVPLLGMFGWWAAFLVWSISVPSTWIATVLLLVLISTLFSYNTFYVQNYNALGWLFFPAGIYAMLHGHWWFAAALWLGASFCSITVVFVAGLLAAALALIQWDLLPLIVLAPAGLKLLVNLAPALVQGNVSNAFSTIAKWIGLGGGKPRYVRIKHGGINHAGFLYYLALYVQFYLFSLFFTGSFQVLFLIGILIYTFNTHAARFADVQTTHMLMVTLATVSMLETPNLWMLAPFWFVISPIPTRLFNYSKKWMMPAFAPFDITDYVTACRDLLAPVPEKKRLLLALEDPQNNYGRIYDGYRHIYELPVGIATEREILAIPTWHAISETNYEGSPDFWGRSPEAVIANMNQWSCEFVMVYQTEERELDPVWIEKGFTSLSQMDWEPLVDLFPMRLGQRYESEPPMWFLLHRSGGD